MGLNVLLPLIFDPAVERVFAGVLGLPVCELIPVLGGDREIEELADVFVEGEGGLAVAQESSLFIHSRFAVWPHTKIRSIYVEIKFELNSNYIHLYLTQNCGGTDGTRP